MKERIEKIGLKKDKIARLLGVSNVTLSYWINETRPIPPEKEDELNKLLLKYESI